MGEAKRRKQLNLQGREEEQIGELGSAERNQILATVSRVPPGEWLNECQTADQAEHWQQMSEEYDKLGAAFAAFFGGECPDDLYQSKKEYELFESWAQSYLKLYQVLRYAWSSIKPRLQELGLPMSEKPGELIQLLILLECSDTFKTCQEFGEFPRRKTYDLMSKSSRIENNTSSDLKRQKAYASVLKDLKSRGLNWMTMPALTLELMRIAQQHSKRSRLTRDALEDFWRTSDRETALLRKNIPLSHSWDGRGNLKFGKEHGRYASP